MGLLEGTERFEVIARLGAGGAGVVYEVLDRQRRARMALKTLRVNDAGAIVRLKREFRALQDLQHPNLVVLGELIEQNGAWFFTMELVHGVDFMAFVRPGLHRESATDSLDEEGHTLQAEAPLGHGASFDLPLVHGGVCDVARLRAALGQLAAGLHAVHAVGMVHRDVKPGNVRVTDEGRVVVLDFGLVTRARSSADELSSPHVVGTAAYMAPEQAAAQRVGPPADWYSVGVMLYEALTGRLPFSGPPLKQLLLKQQREPEPPRALWPEVPEDLEALCSALLRREPGERPGGRDVLERLGVSAGASASRHSAPSGSFEPIFLGRGEELVRLDGAFADVRAQRTVTVLVSGRSGVGKSALVRRYLARAQQAVPTLTVLVGRCHERESVPFKAIDNVADALAEHLASLPPPTVHALLPRGAELLAQVFPQLASVDALARATRAPTLATDPHERRRQLFAALRGLLAGLAARAPLCLAIDDLQWADADSLELLEAVLAPPGAPPLLLLATLRDAASVRLPGDVRALEVPPLPQSEARTLAERLLAQAGAPALAAAAIAEDAGGHPLFIDELARRASAPRSEALGALRLDDALWERAAELGPGTRALLELVVLAGGPLRQSTAQRAAGAPAAEFLRQLGELRVARFCRTSGGRGSDTIEPWHDRVRESLAARLSAERAGAAHEQLAVALEGEAAADPEALAMHWAGAGRPERAAGYALAAARRAASALAFERAVRLYRSALALGAPAGVGLESVHAALGDALAASGRGGEAAAAYLAAVDGAHRGAAIELRRRAAEMRLKIGEFDAGVALLRDVLAPLGMPLPRTPRRALVSLMLGRARLAVRGLGFRRRDPSQLSAETLTRVDLCWSAAVGLGVCDVIFGADFQTRHLRLALATGEPYRISRALSVEAAFVSTAGVRARARVEALLAQARELAVEVGHPHAIGLCDAVHGLTAFQMGDFRGTLDATWPAAEWLRAHCTGVDWEIAQAHLYALLATTNLGRYADVHARFPPLLAEAERRGDRFAETFLRIALYQDWMARDDPDEADRQIARALAGWSQQGFHVQHNVALMASVHVALYRGEGARARIEKAWPALERSLLMRIPNNRSIMHDLRARALLDWARRQPEGTPRRRALADALTHATPLARAAEPYAQGMARAISASVAAQRGERVVALAGYDAAAAIFEAQQMFGHEAAMRWRAAPLAPDDEHGRAGDAALARVRGEGVIDAERFLGVLAP